MLSARARLPGSMRIVHRKCMGTIDAGLGWTCCAHNDVQPVSLRPATRPWPMGQASPAPPFNIAYRRKDRSGFLPSRPQHRRVHQRRNALEEGDVPPPPPLQGAQLMPSHYTASTACVTDSNRPQPLWRAPPTADLTASGAASEAPSLLLHPCINPSLHRL